MTRNKKADLGGIGFESKTNFTDGEIRVSSDSYSITGEPLVTSIFAAMTHTGKTIRCYKCFACQRCFPAYRMTSALVFCRECLRETQCKGPLARQNDIDRIINAVRVFLRGRLEVE